MTSEYAEVRNLLNEYHKLVARRHGFYNDYDAQHVNTALQNTSFDDGTEASTNRREGVAGDLFENDILLTLPQAKALLKEVGKSEHACQLYFNTLQGNANVPRDIRQAQVGLQYYWPRQPISYVFAMYQRTIFSNRFDLGTFRELITLIVESFSNTTVLNLNFFLLHQKSLKSVVARWRTDRLSTKYSSFVVQAVGQALDGSEDANRSQLDMAAMRSIGVIAHETLHALGLWHEQSRSDRDRYIAINYRNVYPGTEGNFEKRSTRTTENMGEPYDLGSVMHYGSKAFAVDYSSNTIRTLDRNFQQTIGQRGRMSFKDIKMINRRYCSNSCKRQLPCQNGGYTNPNRCNQCKCPQGYGGQYCLSVEESGPRLCCSVPTASFLSEGSDFIVIFHTANNVNSQYQGFEIRYKACKFVREDSEFYGLYPRSMSAGLMKTSHDI
ncbi:unnamed protein product [Toxocara canis]|uniref:Metalloendopeptidase n=1 Tax=Toxocara canis TaxID=6265 RepID=A0A183UUM6_TOXCA|nr:unnamed protein product [Toxocara canis]